MSDRDNPQLSTGDGSVKPTCPLKRNHTQTLSLGVVQLNQWFGVSGTSNQLITRFRARVTSRFLFAKNAPKLVPVIVEPVQKPVA